MVVASEAGAATAWTRAATTSRSSDRLRRVAAEQIELILGRAHRTGDSPQRIPDDQIVDPGQRDQQFLASAGPPLAQRGGLGGHVVGAAHHHQGGVLGGQTRQPQGGGDHPAADKLERSTDLELLDVLGEVTRRHGLVDVLVAGQGAELLDARLHVVAGDALPGVDGSQIDVIDHGFIRLDHPVGHVDAQVALRLQDGEPQPSLEDHLVRRRPQLDHLPRRVAPRQHVGDDFGVGRAGAHDAARRSSSRRARSASVTARI